MPELNTMGYTAQLIAHLIKIGGPQTVGQIKRWVAHDTYVDASIEDILGQMVDAGHLELKDTLYFLVPTAHDDDVAQIVQRIMRQYDMETYRGFGMLTIKMLAKMLNDAVRAGEERGTRPF